MAESPISAKIVVSTGGFSGLSKNGGPDSKQTKVMKELLKVTKSMQMNSLAAVSKALWKVVAALGGGLGGAQILGAAATVGGSLGGGLTGAAAMNIGLEGVGLGIDGVIPGSTAENTKNMYDKLADFLENLGFDKQADNFREMGDIQLEINQKEEKVNDTLETEDLPKKVTEVSKAYDDYESAIRAAIAEIKRKNSRKGRYVLDNGTITNDKVLADEDAESGGEGFSLWVDPNKTPTNPLQPSDFQNDKNAPIYKPSLFVDMVETQNKVTETLPYN